MSGNTTPQTMADVTSEGLLATLRGAPAVEPPTRDPEPATPAPAEQEQQAAAQAERAARERDERGRFKPRMNPLDELMARPAEPEGTTKETPEPPASQERPEARPAAPGQAEPPQPAATPSAPPDDLQARLAEAERVNATLRGQVTNAARQAEEHGKQVALKYYRDEVRKEYQDLVARGEATPEQVQAALAVKEQEWSQQDFGQQRQALGQQQVDLALRAQQATVQERTTALYQTAVPLLAKDHGLDPDHVRAIWASDAGEVERFQRAAHQTEAAKTFPQAGFNAASLEDYLATTDHFLRREKHIHESYRTRIAELERELNRQEADNSGVFRAAPSTRGGAPKAKAPEHLSDITRDTWLETLRRNRNRTG